MLKKLLVSLFLTVLMLPACGLGPANADIIRSDDMTSLMNDYEAPPIYVQKRN